RLHGTYFDAPRAACLKCERNAESRKHVTIMNGTGSTTKNVLTSDVEINGTLKFAGELTFEGKLEGDIATEGTLLLGDTSVVRGSINAGSVVVRGKINGNITAKDKIEIKAKTELFGDV